MELGKIQEMKIVRFRDFGAFLSDPEAGEGAETVLLPRKQVPEGAREGDTLSVFLYKDSAGRPIATVRKPLLTVGETGKLTITDVTKIGAFLDIGLERDVLMPFREREGEISPGKTVLCALYVDKSGRLAATMRVYKYLKPAPEGRFEKDAEVSATVYEVRDMGVFCAVEDRYFGLIPKSEVYGEFRTGEEITARVMRVREDGKLDLSPRKKAFRQMDDDAELLLEKLKEAGGSLPFTDDSDPEQIREAFGISKSAFKRAVGRLLKTEKIVLSDSGITLAQRGK